MEIAISGLASGAQIEHLETCPDNFKTSDWTGGVPRKSELKSRRFAVGARNFHFFEGPNFRQIGGARDLPGKFQIERFDGRGPSEIKIEISKIRSEFSISVSGLALGPQIEHLETCPDNFKTSDLTGGVPRKSELKSPRFAVGARNSRFLRSPFSFFAF